MFPRGESKKISWADYINLIEMINKIHTKCHCEKAVGRRGSLIVRYWEIATVAGEHSLAVTHYIVRSLNTLSIRDLKGFYGAIPSRSDCGETCQVYTFLNALDHFL